MLATDLNSLANVAEILSTLTVIGGAVFAVIQLREYRQQRQDAAAVQLARTFYDSEFARAMLLLRTLPDDVPAAELRSHGPEYEVAAVKVCTIYETLGLLVFNDMMSFFLVRELTGGIAVVLWRKLRRWIDDVRREQSQPSWAEWYQWLAERLEAMNVSKEAQPAYMRHSDWRPRS
jgi:hypothetical protein